MVDAQDSPGRVPAAAGSSRWGCYRLVLGIAGWLFFFITVLDTSDGYKFERKEWEKEHVHLTVRLLPDQAALVEEGKRRGAHDLDALSGISLSSKESDDCVVFVVDPDKGGWRPEILGHEVAHCIWGEFHPSQKSAS